MTYYVYVDWTLEETPRVFYVGEGRLSRVKNMRRNRKHQWVSATLGVRREIVDSFLTKEESLREEARLKAIYATFTEEYAHRLSNIKCNFLEGQEREAKYAKRRSRIVSDWTGRPPRRGAGYVNLTLEQAKEIVSMIPTWNDSWAALARKFGTRNHVIARLRMNGLAAYNWKDDGSIDWSHLSWPRGAHSKALKIIIEDTPSGLGLLK